MDQLDIDVLPYNKNRSKHVAKYVTVIISVLLGLLCIGGFVLTSLKWHVSNELIEGCTNDTQATALCYLRLIVYNNLHTQWSRFIMISLLCTYASVFFHIIVESSRTNVSGLLGQMVIQTVFIILGIGVCLPILFIPSYLYFYKSRTRLNKSPVPIDILYIGLIYTSLIIIAPTYLIYFFYTDKLILTIMSIIILLSPLGFALISLPCRLFSEFMQHCWIISSHRLIVVSQLLLFGLSAPLFFIVFVSLIINWSNDLVKITYVTPQTDTINPMPIIWSIDYLSLFISLILCIIINELLFTNNANRFRSSSIKRFIIYCVFAIVFIIAPCLAFPLYIAWAEYQFFEQN